MYADVEDVTLYFEYEGRGPPLVVHHGGPGSDLSTIYPFLRPLRVRIRLIPFDHRGTGRSSAPKDSERYRIVDFVADIEALRKSLRLERIALLGHSFGGIVSQYYALAFPGRLSHLILVSTAASSEFIGEGMANGQGVLGPGAWKELEDISGRPPSAEGMKRAFQLQAPIFFRDPRDLALIDIDRVRWGALSQAAWKHVYGFDLRDKLSALMIPTLVISGRHDRGISLRYSEEIAALVPGAKLAISERSGHFPFAEDPEWFAATLLGFLQPGE